MSLATPFSLYRRSDVYIRHCFDVDTESINERKLHYSNSGNGFSIKETVLDSKLNIGYWSFKCEGSGSTTVSIDYMSGRIHEVVLDRKITNEGVFKLKRGIATLETIYGPSPLRLVLPHRLEPNDTLRLEFTAPNRNSTCEIFKIEVYYYIPIVCDIRNYSPPRTPAAPKVIEIINGYDAFQTTKYLSTEIDMTLVFYSESEHTNFVRNADEIHLFCDEKGHLYRGVLELKDNRWYGRGLYEQNVIFRSPYKLGEGWD